MADLRLTFGNKLGGIAEFCAEVFGLGALKDSAFLSGTFAKRNLLGLNTFELGEDSHWAPILPVVAAAASSPF
jgi:hypothetical protein